MKLWSHSAAQSPDRDRDTQEALSRRYGDSIIILLPLKSGNVAVFDASRQLCGFFQPDENSLWWPAIQEMWHPPEKNWNTEHVTPKKVDPSDMEFL
jgi:hypothetical protein